MCKNECGLRVVNKRCGGGGGKKKDRLSTKYFLRVKWGGVGCVEDQPQYIYSHSGDTVMTRMFVLAVAFVVGMVFSTAEALGQCPPPDDSGCE